MATNYTCDFCGELFPKLALSHLYISDYDMTDQTIFYDLNLRVDLDICDECREKLIDEIRKLRRENGGLK